MSRHLYAVPSPALTQVPAGLRLRAEKLGRDHDAEFRHIPDPDDPDSTAGLWIIWFKAGRGGVQVSGRELGDALNAADEYFAPPGPGTG